MHIKRALITCFLLTCLCAISQEKGYYGKRIFLEIDGQGQLPLLQTIFGEKKGYRFPNNSPHKSYNWIDLAYRASINVTVTETVGFGLEFSQRYYFVNMQSIDELTRSVRDSMGNRVEIYLPAKVGYLPIRETVFMPRVLIALNDGRIPCGFASEIGIGYSMIQLPNKNLDVALDPSAGTSVSSVKNQLIDPKGDDFRGMVFMYGFRMNYPITKRVLFHVGFRYQYTVQFNKKKYRRMDESEYWFSARETWSKINLRRQLGIFSFGTGLTFTL
jgi:hypothetical protein